MKGQPTVWRRTQRLEVRQQEAEVIALAQRLAAVLGCPPQELLAAATAQSRRALAAGAVTQDQW